MYFAKKNQSSEQFVIVALMFASLFLFFAFATLGMAAKRSPLDNSLFFFCHQFTNPSTIRIASFFSFLGTGSFLIPAYIVIVYYLMKRNYEKYAAMIVTIVISSLLSGWLLKLIFHRSRPSEPLVHGAGWYSFPSGHALGMFTFSGVCLFLIWKTKFSYSGKWFLSFVFIFLGFAVGLSRIFLQVHFATDVIGSLFFALFWLMFIYLSFRFGYGVSLHSRNMRSEKTTSPFFLPNRPNP
jgi:undecaprenyl-diphosphatase